jgi:hypothetical protein
VDFERPGQGGKTDQPEQIDAFERELKQAMERRPAPPSLKRRILQQRNMRRTEQVQNHTMWWQRLAEDRRKGEEAKQQVLTALRITNRALNDMNRRLAVRNRDQ